MICQHTLCDFACLAFILKFRTIAASRGVAQPGSVHAWGACGRWFKSSRPDQIIALIHYINGVQETAVFG